MAIRPNRYNDPALGQAFESLAGMFAPLSGSDVAGYAAADASRQKAALDAQRYGLVDMFSNGGDMTPDQRDITALAAGLISDPTKGFVARDMADATDRRGQDLDLAGVKYTSDNTLRSSIFGHVASPLAPGEKRIVPDDVAAWATGGNIGGIDQAGAPKPMTKAEVEGMLLEQAAQDDPAFANWVLGGSKDPVTAVDADGSAILARPHEAAGMGVYEAPNAESVKLTNVRLPDGTQTTALQTADGLIDPVTRQPLPAGTTMFSTAAQGSAEDVGLTTSTAGQVERDLIEIGTAKDTALRLAQMISGSPSSQGLVGRARMTLQNLQQVGDELGQALGGDVQAIIEDAAQQSQELAGSLMSPGGAFDPSLPMIDIQANVLVYQYAKSLTGERLTNEAVNIWRRALGFDNMLSNQADSLARLHQAVAMLDARDARLRASIGNTSIPQTLGTAPAVPGAQATTPLADDDTALFQKYGLQP